jgi:hypothetical protein
MRAVVDELLAAGGFLSVASTETMSGAYLVRMTSKFLPCLQRQSPEKRATGRRFTLAHSRKRRRCLSALSQISQLCHSLTDIRRNMRHRGSGSHASVALR